VVAFFDLAGEVEDFVDDERRCCITHGLWVQNTHYSRTRFDRNKTLVGTGECGIATSA
jgi:hypothetical protein